MFRVVEGDGEWDLLGVTSASVVSVRVELDSRICMPSNVLGRTPSLPLFQALIRDAMLAGSTSTLTKQQHRFNPGQATLVGLQSLCLLYFGKFIVVLRIHCHEKYELTEMTNNHIKVCISFVVNEFRPSSSIIGIERRKTRQPQQGNHVLLSVRQVRDALQWW